jgi:hypothetical protein
MILHGLLMLFCLLAWAPWVFLFNLPIAIWHARRCVPLSVLSAFSSASLIHFDTADRVMRNEHLMDPTEILRFKNLQAARTESIAKTVFYGLQIVYGMYWYVGTAIRSRSRWRTRCN